MSKVPQVGGVHIENLKAGDWIAVISYKEDDYEAPMPPSFFEMISGRAKPTSECSGEPLMVLATHPPFVCVADLLGAHRAAMDLRTLSVTKLSKDYVKAFTTVDAKAKVRRTLESKPSQRKKDELDYGCCPNCKEKMVQRRIGQGSWVYVCKNCERDGGSGLGSMLGMPPGIFGPGAG